MRRCSQRFRKRVYRAQMFHDCVVLAQQEEVGKRIRRIWRRAKAHQLVAATRNVASDVPNKARHDDLEKFPHAHPKRVHERVAAPVSRTHIHPRQQVKVHRRPREVPVQHRVVFRKRSATLGAVVAVHKRRCTFVVRCGAFPAHSCQFAV